MFYTKKGNDNGINNNLYSLNTFSLYCFIFDTFMFKYVIVPKYRGHITIYNRKIGRSIIIFSIILYLI